MNVILESLILTPVGTCGPGGGPCGFHASWGPSGP